MVFSLKKLGALEALSASQALMDEAVPALLVPPDSSFCSLAVHREDSRHSEFLGSVFQSFLLLQILLLTCIFSGCL